MIAVRHQNLSPKPRLERWRNTQCNNIKTGGQEADKASWTQKFTIQNFNKNTGTRQSSDIKLKYIFHLSKDSNPVPKNGNGDIKWCTVETSQKRMPRRKTGWATSEETLSEKIRKYQGKCNWFDAAKMCFAGQSSSSVVLQKVTVEVWHFMTSIFQKLHTLRHVRAAESAVETVASSYWKLTLSEIAIANYSMTLRLGEVFNGNHNLRTDDQLKKKPWRLRLWR